MNVVDSSAWLSYFASDSIIFAIAQKYSALIWTQDNDFEGLANVRYLARKNP